jgi:hypothetical protein
MGAVNIDAVTGVSRSPTASDSPKETSALAARARHSSSDTDSSQRIAGSW